MKCDVGGGSSGEAVHNAMATKEKRHQTWNSFINIPGGGSLSVNGSERMISKWLYSKFHRH